MPFQSFFQIPRRPVELPIYRHLQIPTVNGRAIPLTSRPTVPLPGNFDVSVEKRSNELSEGKKKKKKRIRGDGDRILVFRVSRPRPRVAFNFILEGERARVLSRTRTKSRECFVNRGKERGEREKFTMTKRERQIFHGILAMA